MVGGARCAAHFEDGVSMIRMLKFRHLKKIRRENKELKGRLQAMYMVSEHKDLLIQGLHHKLNEAAEELERSIDKADRAEYERDLYKKVISRAIDRHSTLTELLEDLKHEKHEK